MEHRRIFLFLDIDGVLNTSAQWKRMYSLNDECIAHFADYVHALPSEDAKIILTSSWKNGFDPAGRHSPQIKELIDKLAAHGLSILGKTENDASEDRAKEINDYIRKYHLEQQTCLVIDDDPNIFHSKLSDNCKMLLTDARAGFRNPLRPPDKEDSVVAHVVHCIKNLFQ